MTEEYENAFYDIDTSARSTLPGMSYSGSKEFSKSPNKYLTYKNKVRSPPTPAMTFGRAVDLRLFEPEKYYKTVFTNPFKDRKGNKFKEFELGLPAGNIILPQGLGTTTNPGIDVLDAMVDALSKKARVMEILTAEGIAQPSGLFKDPGFNFYWKVNPDWIVFGDAVVDYKTAASAEEEPFSKQIGNLGYDIQAGINQMGVSVITGIQHRYLWIAQEKEPPYDCIVYQAEEELLDLARLRMRKIAAFYSWCIENDEWPGYADEIQYIGLKPWRKTELLN
jgi:hypothetical protein